ncbi:rhomboid family intramembrane serine protease [Haloarcula pelagica]|uniref:rhomboid family intramembrane serine protease n=1 Tax=Haloarcula pelagica TaxID=3033389 RepID=UPI0024C24192|nr:rhomboid family intramembrane serine protease [Halomicroarcula sp. YJ-61-S]
MLQSLPVPALPGWLPFRELVVVVAVVGSFVAVRRLSGDRLADPLRRRLVLGVPWGTLLTITGVLALYLFLQGAWWHARPLVTPFRTWSYFYPLGILTGPFTHSGQGHVVGNVIGTLVYGTVVEYIWGHYPSERGTQTFTSLRTNPYARVLAIPAASVVVGVFTGLFSLGPVIGFSGVVFAMAGFALLIRPYLFLGALVTNRVVDLVLTALRFPEPTVRGQSRFVTPWWSDVAIQGHAIGVVAGILLAAMLLWARGRRPDPRRVFAATVVYAAFQGLWAVYVPLGNARFTLFRWLGTALVFLLAAVVAAATADTDEHFILRPRFEAGWIGWAGVVLLIVMATLSLGAVPGNLTSIDADDVPEDGIEIRDYVVAYEEDVLNQYAANIPTPIETEQTRVNESGIVVASDAREIWIAQVPKGQLATSGRASVTVGGVGWRETVFANRTTWNVAGNRSVYVVQLWRRGEAPRTSYRSPPSTADATIGGRNVTLRPDGSGFELAVSQGNETLATGPVPANTSTREIGGLTFEHNRSRLYAEFDDTRVRVATVRVPPGQRT